MNKQYKSILFVLASVFLLFFASASVFGQALSIEEARAEFYNKANSLLDRIEQASPQSYTDVVKLREQIHYLNDTAAAESEVRAANEDLGLSVDTNRGRRAARGDWQSFYNSVCNLSNGELKDALAAKISGHTSIDYSSARRQVILKIDNKGGYIECCYTGRVQHTGLSMPSSTEINIEHTWPQSKGATGVAKSDMHHLFAADSKANSMRGNLPFGEVSCADWQQGGSECDHNVFEVRQKHCGNTARAMFYFSVRYNKPISSAQEKVLRHWNEIDPVDADELARNGKVEAIQGNRNPFVDRPDFVNAINDF